MTFDPAAAGWKNHTTGKGFTALVGPVWSRREGESWVYGFQAEERHANFRGVVHGGMLMSFADHALGLVVWNAVERRATATVGLNSQFVAAARPGDWIEGRARIVRKTRSLVFVQGALTANGMDVLVADGIWKILGEN